MHWTILAVTIALALIVDQCASLANTSVNTI
jgi:hypothetical protein